MELFGVSKKRAPVESSAIESAVSEPAPVREVVTEAHAYSFAALGLCDWICQSVAAMGFKKPTDIQAACIPSILRGCDVMGCAETGSGKTAAFALPMLHQLSADPYGIFGIILTPTRELAIQISEQVAAFGVPMGVRQALIIGGVSMTEQSLALAKMPHIVIATPGRLRHHLEGASPPLLNRAQYLVLDEADRLLTAGFDAELRTILSRMGPKRKTLLFSATLTDSLAELESLAMKDTVRFDLTRTQKIPAQLQQQYLFVPAQVKLCYLVAVVRGVLLKQVEDADSDEDEATKNSSAAMEIIKDFMADGSGKKMGGKEPHRSKTKEKEMERRKRKREESGQSIKATSSSMIIFLGSCKRCEEVAGILQNMDIDCVSLHSMLSQQQRINSLAKFKSRECRILVATDVASRGLDIPAVELVINVDLPKVVSDYVHRVGRCARAGRSGRCLSLVTQYDIELVHAIEDYIGSKLQLSEEASEKDVVELLNPVSKAMRMVQMKLMESGFEEKVEEHSKRKKKAKRKVLRQSARAAKTSSVEA